MHALWSCGTCSLVIAFALCACGREHRDEVRSKSAASEQAQTRASDPSALPSLRVSELLAPGAELAPSSRATSLSGERVRLVGFVAEMEIPPADALYLVPAPLRCDEAGGGTADLPPDAVLVALPDNLKQRPEHVPGAVEAVGVLEVGNRSDAHGRIANFRLRLEASNVQRAL